MSCLPTTAALILLMTPAQPSPELDVAELFVKANSLYDQGEYENAVQTFESLIARGAHGGWLYFNLGNARLRAGNLGGAIAAYRVAESMLPRSGDVAANLRFARQSTKDALPPPESSAVKRALFFWHYGLSRMELLVGALITNAMVWLSATWRVLRGRWAAGAWVVALSVVMTLALGASWAIRTLHPQRVAVITSAKAQVHSGTSADTVVRFVLHAGAEGEVIDTHGQWLRIKLADDKQGWIDGRDATLVRL